MADDNREERPDLDRLRRQAMSLPEAAAAARYVERLEAAIEFPPSRPSPQAMEMACQRALRTERDRAEKAEADARDLRRIAREQWWHNHLEHCCEWWPHDGQCMWRLPPELQAPDGDEKEGNP